MRAVLVAFQGGGGRGKSISSRSILTLTIQKTSHHSKLLYKIVIQILLDDAL